MPTRYQVVIAQDTYIGPADHPKFKPTYCIATDRALFVAPSMAECARQLRIEADQTAIIYAGELMPLHRDYLIKIAQERGLIQPNKTW